MFHKLTKHIRQIMQARLSVELYYHGPGHTFADVIPAVERLIDRHELNVEERYLLLTAALLHDLGYIERYANNEQAGAEMARQILPSFGYNEEQIARVAELILATRMPQRPIGLLQKILCDADLDTLGREDFFQSSMALWRESCRFNEPVTLAAWLQGQLAFLENHTYFTQAARELRNHGKRKNIAELQTVLGDSCETPCESLSLPPATTPEASYTPRPLDTIGLTLPVSLTPLLEDLARLTHDVWAQQRIADGWRYGEHRDDGNRLHPCLVEYGSLPEAEKEYDRKISVETLLTILRLGYQIIPPAVSEFAEDWEQGCFTGKACSELLEMWRTEKNADPPHPPAFFLELGKTLLKKGEPLIAYDIFSTGVEALGDVVVVNQLPAPQRLVYFTLLQQQALSLAQAKAPNKARAILETLLAQGHADGETHGILGRTCKDLALQEKDHHKARVYLSQAFTIYQTGYTRAHSSGDLEAAYYNGINAATLALFLDDTATCQRLALEVEAICRHLLAASASSAWLYGTLGESALLRGDWQAAEAFYGQAARGMKDDRRALSSMRKQAAAILRHRGDDPEFLERCLPVAKVAVLLVGNDCAHGKSSARLDEESLAVGARQCLRENRIGILYATPATVEALLLLESARDLGLDFHLLLPFEQNRFVAKLISCLPLPNAISRYEALTRLAASLEISGHYDPECLDNVCAFNQVHLLGRAMIQAENLGTALRLFRCNGGTEPFVCADVAIDSLVGSMSRCRTLPIRHGMHHYSFLALLFADVKGYSRLSELQQAIFGSAYLAQVGRLAKEFRDGIQSKRTQGDGLFFVFTEIGVAYRFALELQAMLQQTDWQAHGLPSQLAIRISLDAGPCYSYTDPVVNRLEFCGAYVIRAARLEPVTPPGQIYASETFVAVAKATGAGLFAAEYAGQVILPKGYGTLPTYHLSAPRVRVDGTGRSKNSMRNLDMRTKGEDR